MSEIEFSKPVGISIAAAVAVLLIGLVYWFAVGRGIATSATPSTVGVPAVASPAMAPPDAAGTGGLAPGQAVAPGTALAPGAVIPQ